MTITTVTGSPLAISSELTPADGGDAIWVLLSAEARRRGFRNTLAFRRWCKRRGVVIRVDGRLQWVHVADVDRAVEAFPTVTRPCPESVTSPDAAVAASVAAVMMTKRRR